MVFCCFEVCFLLWRKKPRRLGGFPRASCASFHLSWTDCSERPEPRCLGHGSDSAAIPGWIHDVSTLTGWLRGGGIFCGGRGSCERGGFRVRRDETCADVPNCRGGVAERSGGRRVSRWKWMVCPLVATRPRRLGGRATLRPQKRVELNEWRSSLCLPFYLRLAEG